MAHVKADGTALTALCPANEHGMRVARMSALPGDRLTLTFEPDESEPLSDFEEFVSDRMSE